LLGGLDPGRTEPLGRSRSGGGRKRPHYLWQIPTTLGPGPILVSPVLYKDEAVVLRTMRLGEADRIVTFVGRGQGKIRAVAKGVRKTKSRFGGRLEPFTQVSLGCGGGAPTSTSSPRPRPSSRPAASGRTWSGSLS